MGWLWGSSDGNGANSNDKDKLDPSLRAFLASGASSETKPDLPTKPASKPSNPPPSVQDNTANSPPPPAVPPQSQFQDGRYAHLWKDYVPQQTLYDRSKTEQDKLKDIVDAYNDRRASIGRAAMENCAMEYLDQFNCMKAPTFYQAATVCREESRKFNRCYEMQSKFLKALGYLTMDARTPEEDEAIQMHADKLYQQMKEQQALIEKSKEEGKPMPKFESVLSKRNITQAMSGKPLINTPLTGTEKPEEADDNDVWSHIKADARKEYEKKLAELPPEEQEIERRALLGELRAQAGMASKVEEAFVEERINRMKRREAGQSTFGDTIKRLWGWG